MLHHLNKRPSRTLTMAFLPVRYLNHWLRQRMSIHSSPPWPSECIIVPVCPCAYALSTGQCSRSTRPPLVLVIDVKKLHTEVEICFFGKEGEAVFINTSGMAGGF
ncbi:hypothetical protein [Desulfofarcimen acetoxidans]|uniref:hypothetical protein n=1 Tax=Desulfofarcimen acetoxidans TaxID=58138 RepID=UPI0012FF080A|nr:hypothetical protein [Desulfofarcimen acetoxidans]